MKLLQAPVHVQKYSYACAGECREGQANIAELKDQKALRSKIQEQVKSNQQKYKRELEDELQYLEKLVFCSRHDARFAGRAAEKHLRLPWPLQGSWPAKAAANARSKASVQQADTSVWTLQLDHNTNELSASGMSDQQMLHDLRSRRGLQLIVVLGELQRADAHLQYPCVKNSAFPLIKWANIREYERTQIVAHLALFVDGTSRTPLFQELQMLQKPASRDCAARLDICLSTGLPGLEEAVMSLQLNLSQACNESVKVHG